MPKDKTDKEDDAEQSEEDGTEEASDASKLKPVRPKIGESSDNLEQREDWFQKRSGRK